VRRDRTFRAGERLEAGGVHFLVRAGGKGGDDLCLDVLINGRWQPLLLETLFLAIDFICQNEDYLYPAPRNGGEEVLRYCRMARQQGWLAASLELQRKRADKANREFYGDGAA
jgi:hypothetical protein